MGIASLQLLFPEGRADYVLKTYPLLLLNLQTCWRRLALNKISTLSLVPSPSENIQQILATEFTLSLMGIYASAACPTSPMLYGNLEMEKKSVSMRINK